VGEALLVNNLAERLIAPRRDAGLAFLADYRALVMTIMPFSPALFNRRRSEKCGLTFSDGVGGSTPSSAPSRTIAYTGRKELIGTFSANLETLPGATGDPKTAEWWAQQPEAWAACRQELEMPETAMRRYVLWLKPFPESRYLSATQPDSISYSFTLRSCNQFSLAKRRCVSESNFCAWLPSPALHLSVIRVNRRTGRGGGGYLPNFEFQ
jgi:hypothetical protein